MKRKVLLSLVLIIALFVVTGCGNDSVNKTDKKESNSFSVNDVVLNFDVDETFKDFNYKTADQIRPELHDYWKGLTYENVDVIRGNYVFKIELLVDKESDLEKWAKKNETPEVSKMENKVFNKVSWKYYESSSNDSDLLVKHYLIEKDRGTREIKVMAYKTAKIDLDKLADMFMKNVSFSK